MKTPAKIIYPFLTLIFLIIFNSILNAQFETLKFGADSTLDVVSWNIEHFPKEGQITIDYVADLMVSIDADIYAIQEVTSETDLQTLLSQMDGWDYAYAYNQYAALAFIYKTDSIRDVNFYEIYTTKSREFPRSPFVMEFTFMAQPFIIINNHFKCCGDNVLDYNDNWDEEKRRFDACVLLDEYIETYHNEDKVIITGDLNDMLTDDFADNVFEIFVQNFQNYQATDMEIAEGPESNWSYPSWPSHLDHIIITNEFFDDYSKTDSETKTIKPDEYFAGGFGDYDDMVSDHRPMGIKLKTESYLSVGEVAASTPLIFPNPVLLNGLINFSNVSEFTTLKIYSISGQLKEEIDIKSNNFALRTTNLRSGIFLVKFQNSKGEYRVSRLIVK